MLAGWNSRGADLEGEADRSLANSQPAAKIGQLRKPRRRLRAWRGWEAPKVAGMVARRGPVGPRPSRNIVGLLVLTFGKSDVD